MDSPDQYEILFTGLKPGRHIYDFEVGKTFFEHFENSGILDGEVKVIVEMDKEERMMDFHFGIDGTVEVLCDRCNSPTRIRISGKERLIVKLGDAYIEESDEVQVIPESVHKFGLGTFIYEYVSLLLPARKVHPDAEDGSSGCDPTVLRKLEELSDQHHPDPRWEALSKLKTSES